MTDEELLATLRRIVLKKLLPDLAAAMSLPVFLLFLLADVSFIIIAALTLPPPDADKETT